MWHVRLWMRATRPRARARQRLIVGPSSMYAAETTRSSPLQFRFGCVSAFATAERRTFSISRAAARCVNASTVRASGTLRPRMCSVTTRALRADTRTQRASARTSVRSVLPLLDLRLRVARVAAERPRGRELAELVPDHLLRDEHRHVLAAVVHRDR